MASSTADPSGSGRQLRAGLVAGIAGWVLAEAAVVGGMTAWAQHTGRSYFRSLGLELNPNSLVEHVVAMTALAALAVGTASALARAGARHLAPVVLACTAAGPLSLAAPPVTRALVGDDVGTRWWWLLLVSAAQFGLLGSATWWAARRPGSGTTRQATRPWLAGTVFAAVAAASLAGQAASAWNESPRSYAILPMLGWSALAAGTAVVLLKSPWRWTAPLALVDGAAVLWLMSLAYDRAGGWPGVAGWELGTPPIVLRHTSWYVLLAPPVAALAVRAFLALARRATRHPSPVT